MSNRKKYSRANAAPAPGSSWSLSGSVRATMSAAEADLWHRGDDWEAPADARPIGAFAEYVAAEHFIRNGRLFSELKAALFGWRGDSTMPRDRARLVLALRLFSEFIGENKDVPYAIPIAGELEEYAKGIEELDRGTIRHFLKPADVSQARIEPGDKWLLRAKVATLIQWGIEHEGDTRGVRAMLARTIAQAHPYLADALAPGTPDLADLIASWHRMFANGSAKDERAQAFFDQRSDLFTRYAEHYRKLDPAGARDASDYACAVMKLMSEISVSTAMTTDPEAMARIRAKVLSFRKKSHA